MKYRLFLIIATFAVLGSSISSCSLDDELRVAPNDGDPKTPISFNVNIGSLPDPVVTTRGNADVTGTTYTFSSGDKVALAIRGVSGSSRPTNSDDLKLYTVAAGSGTQSLTYASGGSNAFDWLSTSEVISLRAWSIGNSTTTTTDPDGQSISLSTSQNSDADTQELLYSPATNYSYGSINIPLYHQMARIVVNVTSTITTGVSVTGVQIGHTDYKIPLSGKYAKPSSGNYGSWDLTSVTPTTGVINAKEETSGSVYSAVVIPAGTSTYAAGNKFIVISTASSGTFCYTIPTGGFNFEPGKQYTFTITSLNQIDFNVTVNAWDGGSSEPAATDLTFSN